MKNKENQKKAKRKEEVKRKVRGKYKVNKIMNEKKKKKNESKDKEEGKLKLQLHCYTTHHWVNHGASDPEELDPFLKQKGQQDNEATKTSRRTWAGRCD